MHGQDGTTFSVFNKNISLPIFLFCLISWHGIWVELSTDFNQFEHLDTQLNHYLGSIHTAF